MIIKVGGLDCALKNLGIAIAKIDVTTGLIEVQRIALVQTEKGKDKQVRRNSDDLVRSQTLNHAMRKIEPVIDFWMAEIPTGAQSARAALAFGVAIGALGGLTKPIIEVQPTDVKKIVTGRKSASKDEIIQWAYNLYPNLSWLRARGNPKGDLILDNEHMADAIGIIHAGVATKQFKEAVAMLQSIKANAALDRAAA